MEVEQIEIREHLRRHAPFNLLPDKRLDALARRIEIRYFRAGSEIVALGQTVTDLHYIRKGAVEIRRRDGELYNRLGESEMFGQLGLMTGKPARFPVRAIEDTLIYYIPGEEFHALFKESEAFADFVEVEDRTRLRQAASDQIGSNALLTEKVSALVSRDPVTVLASTTIRDAARRMTDESVGSVLVLADKPDPETGAHAMVGILTDSDLRRRVVAQGVAVDRSVGDVMTTDLITVDCEQFAFEALQLMLRENVHFLPVVRRLRPAGVIELADIVSRETRSSLYLVRDILHLDSVEEMRELVPEVRQMFLRMTSEDANSRMIGTAIASVGRTFKHRLLELGEEKLGPPPVPYCFLALGSMARDEQYMLTDQDNAMILDNAFDARRHDEYFRELARFVSDGLAAVGYSYCKGGIMATNKQWRQPLEVWREKFREWIDRPHPEGLLNSSIFFDLDGVHGDTRMADELKALLAERASRSPDFLGCLAHNAQRRTPPLGFFKDFVLEKSGRHQNSINLKRRGTAPMVDVIRVHALASGSQAQNSFRRLDDIQAAGFLTASMSDDLRDALEFIAVSQIRHQAARLAEGKRPNNNIDPENLTSFERRNLKDAFRVLSNAQRFLKMRYRPGGRA